MKTHIEISIPFIELYRNYCDEDLTYICWLVANKLKKQFMSDNNMSEYYDSVIINEDVAMMLYQKYREFVPSKAKWDISGHPTIPSSTRLLEEYGITCLFHPDELNEMIGDAISIDHDEIKEDLCDWEKCQRLHNDCIRHSHMMNVREHILRVISENDPNGVITVSADF